MPIPLIGKSNKMTLIMLKWPSIFSTLFLLLLLLIIVNNATHAQEINNDFESDETWSQCNCPPPSSPSKSTVNQAKMAYLISVHNRRTLHDAAYLLKSLMETSQRGNTAVILIHVDHRVGIANPADEVVVAKNETTRQNQFLYHESPLRRYVDACLANSCARSGNSAHNDKTNANNNVLLEVHSHFEPKWGQWSMNEPTLWAMEYLLYHRQFQRSNHNLLRLGNKNKPSSSPKAWDVFVNLSGDTLPVISAQRISQLFNPIDGPLGNTNFVTSSSCATGLIPTSIFEFPKGTMKRSHYFQHDIPKRLSYIDTLTGEWRVDVEVPIYFGSQWMALTHDFVEFVIRSMDHPNGMGNVLKETLVGCGVLMTDESFFATMLMNSPFRDTVPQLLNNTEEEDKKSLARYPSMKALRYERMDENAPNAWDEWTRSDSFYDIPPKFTKVTDGEGPSKPWGPYFLGLYDLGGIKESGAIFIRKVSWSVDENLVRLLPVVLGNDEMREGLSEWDVLPDFQWPVNGVKVHDPFVWRVEDD